MINCSSQLYTLRSRKSSELGASVTPLIPFPGLSRAWLALSHLHPGAIMMLPCLFTVTSTKTLAWLKFTATSTKPRMIVSDQPSSYFSSSLRLPIGVSSLAVCDRKSSFRATSG